MADLNDLQSLHGILLGLGLKDLPNLLMSLHKVQTAGKNLSEGRAHNDNGPTTQDQNDAVAQGNAYDIQSALLPILAQLNAQGGGQQALPVNAPGMRPGSPPAPLPRMGGLPRTMQAGASPSGF